MTSAQGAAALDALRAVSPALASLDAASDPVAAGRVLRDTGDSVERALRALAGGSALEGTALIHELRQRETLTLGQAHVLVELFAARDRASRQGYRATSADVETARAAVNEIRVLAGATPATHPGDGFAAPATRVPAAPTVTSADPAARPARSGRRWVVWGAVAVVLVGLGVAGVIVGRPMLGDSLPPGVQEGADLMDQGRADEAVARLTQASIDYPSSAAPHVYLARIARDRSDLPTARAELVRAIRLEPTNALAQREMGSLLLASGETELATKFYARAIDGDPTDRVAMGLLGCALSRLGRPDEAARWLTRAGNGEWSVCARPPSP